MVSTPIREIGMYLIKLDKKEKKKRAEADPLMIVNVKQKIKKIGQSPDNIIIIRNRRPIPIDEEILDGDRIKLIPVFSRG